MTWPFQSRLHRTRGVAGRPESAGRTAIPPAVGSRVVTELEIPPKADGDEATDLVQEFLDVGDRVEVWDEEMTTGGDSGRVRARGDVTGIEPGFLELDGDSPNGESVRYDEIHTIKRIA